MKLNIEQLYKFDNLVDQFRQLKNVNHIMHHNTKIYLLKQKPKGQTLIDVVQILNIETLDINKDIYIRFLNEKELYNLSYKTANNYQDFDHLLGKLENNL